MNTVYLFDMDGVLCDFVGGSLAVHGKTIPPAEVQWDFYSQVGLTSGEFWRPLEHKSFWSFLPTLTDGLELFLAVAAVVPKEQIGFLSSPLCPGSADGKRAWLSCRLPGFEKSAIFTAAKHLVAGPGKVLIDDWEKNTEPFEAAGGRSVLVPRPWNRRRGLGVSGEFRVSVQSRVDRNPLAVSNLLAFGVQVRNKDYPEQIAAAISAVVHRGEPLFARFVAHKPPPLAVERPTVAEFPGRHDRLQLGVT